MFALIMLIGLSSVSGARHAYYFGFAEMEYKEDQGRIEVSLSLSSHDVEDVWKKKGALTDSWAKTENNPENNARILSELKKGFQLNSGKITANWTLDGYELHKNGLIYFYLHAAEMPRMKQVSIYFDLLMDAFPEQQNKVTFIHAGKKQTAVFLKDKKEQKLSL